MTRPSHRVVSVVSLSPQPERQGLAGNPPGKQLGTI